MTRDGFLLGVSLDMSVEVLFLFARILLFPGLILFEWFKFKFRFSVLPGLWTLLIVFRELQPLVVATSKMFLASVCCSLVTVSGFLDSCFLTFVGCFLVSVPRFLVSCFLYLSPWLSVSSGSFCLCRGSICFSLNFASFFVLMMIDSVSVLAVFVSVSVSISFKNSSTSCFHSLIGSIVSYFCFRFREYHDYKDERWSKDKPY